MNAYQYGQLQYLEKQGLNLGGLGKSLARGAGSYFDHPMGQLYTLFGGGALGTLGLRKLLDRMKPTPEAPVELDPQVLNNLRQRGPRMAPQINPNQLQ